MQSSQWLYKAEYGQTPLCFLAWTRGFPAYTIKRKCLLDVFVLLDTHPQGCQQIWIYCECSHIQRAKLFQFLHFRRSQGSNMGCGYQNMVNGLKERLGGPHAGISVFLFFGGMIRDLCNHAAPLMTSRLALLRKECLEYTHPVISAQKNIFPSVVRPSGIRVCLNRLTHRSDCLAPNITTTFLFLFEHAVVFAALHRRLWF